MIQVMQWLRWCYGSDVLLKWCSGSGNVVIEGCNDWGDVVLKWCNDWGDVLLGLLTVRNSEVSSYFFWIICIATYYFVFGIFDSSILQADYA